MLDCLRLLQITYLSNLFIKKCSTSQRKLSKTKCEQTFRVQSGVQCGDKCSCLCLQMSERLLDVENEAMLKIVELEKQLMQTNKELDQLRVSTVPVNIPQFSSAETERMCVLMLCRTCTPAPTLRCTPYAGWFGRRIRPFEGRVAWSVKLRRPSRLEDLELLSLRGERGMGVWRILPPPLLHLVQICPPGKTHHLKWRFPL